MPDGKPITDPETIAAYVRMARIVYGIDDDQCGLSEIDNPPTVVETLGAQRSGRGFRSPPCRMKTRSSSMSSAPLRQLRVREKSWRGSGCRSRTLSFASDGARTSAPPKRNGRRVAGAGPARWVQVPISPIVDFGDDRVAGRLATRRRFAGRFVRRRSLDSSVGSVRAAAEFAPAAVFFRPDLR